VPGGPNDKGTCCRIRQADGIRVKHMQIAVIRKLHIPNAMSADQESKFLWGSHGAILDEVF